MIDIFKKNDNQLFAPARQGPPEKLHLLYLSYYQRFQLRCAALEEFHLLRRASPRASWKGLPIMLKSLRNAVKSCLI